MNLETGPLFDRIIQGDRVALGRAMTLVESERSEDRDTAIDLLALCEEKVRGMSPSLRLTISGAPGAGKSTLIETLGLRAIEKGHKVGVITVDPSSSLSHGSILGDKSRMTGLSTSNDAFIRSSPAGHVRGGLGRRSLELMTLLETAGFNLILVETVGVGQSEHTAWQLTDGFILVVQPGAGDELQGIKRGITELADLVIINKADGDLKELARVTRSHYTNALHYFSGIREGWTPATYTCSALEGTGLDKVLEGIHDYQRNLMQSGRWSAERNKQKLAWLHWSLGMTAHELFMNHPVIRNKMERAIHDVSETVAPLYKTAYQIESAMAALIQSQGSHSEI